MNEEDQRISAWEKVAKHPLFRECYDEERPLIDSVLDTLDRVGERAESPSVELAVAAEEPVEARLSRAYVNGFREGMERASRGRLDHW
jgi:cobalamin-dependent methionine synthase I